MRQPTEKDFKAALRLLGLLASPRGDWRDDEARRRARVFLKKWDRKEKEK